MEGRDIEGPDSIGVADVAREANLEGVEAAGREGEGMSDKEPIKAPFPWFGGKSRAAHLVWPRFGDVQNYVEPFFGSGAVLLGRPHPPQLETCNDKDGFIANFFRAIQHDPEQTAYYADQPVNENDLHAKHIYLVNHRAGLTAKLEGDPEFYDAKIAGWWVWGICCWIGSGWCSGKGPWQSVDGKLVNTGDGNGVKRQRVHLGDKGQGVNRQCVHLGRDQGVNRKLDVESGVYEWFAALSDRLRRVRVCCGDWSRICGLTLMIKNGLTGVLMDPPYPESDGRDMDIYAEDCGQVAHDVRGWCIANGDNPLLRVAYCGYEGQEMPDSWECVAWKTNGGYGSQGDGRGFGNRYRERMWFSPYCLRAEQISLFRAFAEGEAQSEHKDGPSL